MSAIVELVLVYPDYMLYMPLRLTLQLVLPVNILSGLEIFK